MFSLALLFVQMFLSVLLALCSPRLGKRELVYNNDVLLST